MKCLCLLLFLVIEVLGNEEKLLVKNARIKYNTITNTYQIKKVENLKYFDDSVVNGTHLKILRSSTTLVPVIYEGSFRNMKNLRMLQLPSLGITTIEPYAFKNLSSLDRIQLQDNNLTAILNDVFNFLPISQIFLHRNNIKYIQSGAFDSMPNLHTIKLNRNELKEWDSNWFSNTPKLTDIFIRRNHIAYLQENAFKNIRKLQVGHDDDENSTSIYLSKNKISTIHPSALSGLVRLNNFYLDRNKLTELPDTLFFKIESIVSLNLKKNKIKSLSPNMFSTTNTLKVLDLTMNALNCIPVEIATKPKQVFLKDNKLDCNCTSILKEAVAKSGKENVLKMDNCKREEMEEEDEYVGDEDEYDFEEDEEE